MLFRLFTPNDIYVDVINRGKDFIDQNHCWYVMPEVLIGIPKYDYRECTAYIINKLQSNGFIVRYTHPNLLFISWNHWVPQYVRNEIKKKNRSYN